LTPTLPTAPLALLQVQFLILGVVLKISLEWTLIPIPPVLNIIPSCLLWKTYKRLVTYVFPDAVKIFSFEATFMDKFDTYGPIQ